VRAEAPAVNPLWLKLETLALPGGREGGWLVRLRDVTTHMALQCDSWSFQVMVGHKLRTPLTSIIGSLELVARHAPRLSLDEIVEFVQIALRNVKRLHNDVEEILQYVNVSGLAGRDGATRIAGLEPLVKLLGNELSLTETSVSVEAGLETGELGLSPQAVELILWELLENSKKFHPQKSPQVQVALARRAPDAAAPGVRLCVRDDGAGVAPELAPRVWSPYYQAEKSFTGEIVGMGLGLPMVAILVWSVGGACRLHNRQDGPGVVVELDLPYAPGQPPT
jgi:signal transduction histidine kinase